MNTNKYAATCEDCGEHVPAGKGVLSSEWNNHKDDTEWVVRHADKSICAAVTSAQVREHSKHTAITTGINYIKSHGTLSANIMDGETVIYDGRKGYNQVGWLLTRTSNTMYLTSRNNLDGMDMSETYIYETTQSGLDDLLWTMELIS